MEKFLHPECKFELQVEVDFGCHRMTKSDEVPMCVRLAYGRVFTFPFLRQEIWPS